MTLKKRKEPLKCKNKNKKNKKEHDKRRDSVGEVDYHILPQLVAVLRYPQSVTQPKSNCHFKIQPSTLTVHHRDRLKLENLKY
jgi:hypothetical protein